MNIRTVGWLLGVIWTGLAGAQLVPLGLALLRSEPWLPFAQSAGISLAGGLALLGLLRRAPRSLDHRSAFLAVTLIGASACALGALPFALHPELQLAAADALLESVAGWTTTSATVLAGLDQLPRSLLLWRSISQWLGGMAMILLGVAVLPLLAVGGMQIYRAETPGPTQDKITTRISETARFLWGLYVGLTVALGVLYAVCGMGIFDAVCHAMTTLATGGFSTHDASFGHFDSGAILLVAIAGMLLGGTSFVLLHRSLTGGVRWSEQTELRTYVGFFALATALVSADLLAEGGRTFRSLADLILHAGFQVASILTTTGYTSHDYELWPALSRGVLFALFLVGGMAGSTAGGVKVIRIALLARLAFSQFFRLLHPHAVSVVSLGRGAVNDEVLASAAGFVMLWIGMLGAGTGVLALLGNDFFVSLGVALASLGNVGTGFGEIGASETYASFGASSKLVLAALMFLGRLEIYTVLIILTPGFWRR